MTIQQFTLLALACITLLWLTGCAYDRSYSLTLSDGANSVSAAISVRGFAK